MTDQVPAIELKGISKAFGPVQANKDISIRVMPGTVHGIIGENGAGKSTLMSILYGFYKADSGEIWINGKRQGAAPLMDKTLKPGRYRISAGQEGPSQSKTLRLRPGERKTVNFDLTE